MNVAIKTRYSIGEQTCVKSYRFSSFNTDMGKYLRSRFSSHKLVDHAKKVCNRLL